jgi:FkbM family methyltransferase
MLARALFTAGFLWCGLANSSGESEQPEEIPAEGATRKSINGIATTSSQILNQEETPGAIVDTMRRTIVEPDDKVWSEYILSNVLFGRMKAILALFHRGIWKLPVHLQEFLAFETRSSYFSEPRSLSVNADEPSDLPLSDTFGSEAETMHRIRNASNGIVDSHIASPTPIFVTGLDVEASSRVLLSYSKDMEALRQECKDSNPVEAATDGARLLGGKHRRSGLPEAMRLMCPTGDASHDAAVLQTYAIGKRIIGFGFSSMLQRAQFAEGRFGREHSVKIWYDPSVPNHGMPHTIMREQEEDVYKFREHGPAIPSGDWILDFGGNIGAAVVHERLSAQSNPIVTIEPSPVNFFWLMFNIVQNRLYKYNARIVALNAGLAVKPGIAQGALRGGRTHVGASATKKWMTDAKKNGWKHFSINMLTLPSLMKTLDISRFGLMKIDCEGCEFQLSLHWRKLDLFRSFGIIVGEYHQRCNYEDVAEGGLSKEDVKTIWWLFCGSPESKQYTLERHPTVAFGCQCEEYGKSG